MKRTEQKFTKEEIKQKVKKSLQYSVKDGAWWSVMIGSGESFLATFAMFLKATSFEIGMIQAFPQFIASILQLSAVKLSSIVKSRQAISIYMALLQAITWLAIIGVSYFFKSPIVLILLATIYFVFGKLPSPAWSSWMGDLVTKETRGKYFGYRSRITGIVTFLATLASGMVLDYFQALHDTFTGFAILFTSAFIARLVSTYYLSLKYEPHVQVEQPRKYGFIKFCKEMHTNHFGNLTLFTSLFLLGTYISSPFFVIYWINLLGFSYLQFSILIAVATMTTFIVIPYWGKSADKYGNNVILEFSAILACLTPLMAWGIYFMPKDMQFPANIIMQIIAGFAWAGFNLIMTNMQLNLVQHDDRIRLFSYNEAVKGTAMFAGTLIGGIFTGLIFTNSTFARFVPNGILLVMIISVLVRYGSLWYFTKKIRELETKNKRPNFLHFITTMPVQGLMFESVTGMNRTVKTVKAGIQSIKITLHGKENKKKVTKKNKYNNVIEKNKK